MRPSRRAASVEPFHAMDFGRRAAELARDGADIVRLSIGEPDFGAPPAVREAMRAAMDGRPLPYSAALGLPELRSEIARFYREQHGVDVDPARIVVTSGASSALLLVLAAVVDPGDEVVLGDPSYPVNRQLIRTFGGEPRLVATTPESRYQLDLESVRHAIGERTSAVMVATPSNPTGTSVPFDELAAICAHARDRGVWPIVDEIYLNLSDDEPDGRRARTILSADPDAIVIDSFSKYFGMTGWRLGWAVLPQELVGPVERLAMNYFLSASTPAQIAATACFTPESLAICEERRAELQIRRRIVLAGLEQLGLPVPVHPDGAFYVYFDVSGTGLGAWEFCERVLEEAHVALTPGRDFSSTTADTHVRLSYAASRDDLFEALRRIRTFLDRLER